MSYADLDRVLGITADPTDTNWAGELGPYDFWLGTTEGQFSASETQYNYKWSHPCLCLVHKVIRMAFLGHTEINKVHTHDLRCMWTMIA